MARRKMRTSSSAIRPRVRIAAARTGAFSEGIGKAPLHAIGRSIEPDR
jgi:hypothetical protein